MTTVAEENLTDLSKRLEAFQTPRWAVEAILDVEITTPRIFDPCCGLGAIGEVCRERLLDVEEMDIEDWGEHFPELNRAGAMVLRADFLAWGFNPDLSNHTVIMNPPFSKAAEFVDRARMLNARKIICFQRQAWRESAARRWWWEGDAPARVWVCGSRATCWRFDLLKGGDQRPKMHNTQTSHAWYVWERGHKSAEVMSAIFPPENPKRQRIP